MLITYWKIPLTAAYTRTCHAKFRMYKNLRQRPSFFISLPLCFTKWTIYFVDKTNTVSGRPNISGHWCINCLSTPYVYMRVNIYCDILLSGMYIGMCKMG